MEPVPFGAEGRGGWRERLVAGRMLSGRAVELSEEEEDGAEVEEEERAEAREERGAA